MRSLHLRPICAAFGLALVAASAPAAGAPGSPMQLEGYVKQEKIIRDERGQPAKVLVDPVTVVPGDRLVMGTRYVNTGAAAIANVVVSNPVPAPVRVSQVPDPGQIVSVDGGRSFGPFAESLVTAADGTRRPATPDDITHFRWTFAAVAPGERGAVEYVVTVR